MPQSDWDNLDRNITATWGDVKVPNHLSQFGKTRTGDRSSLLTGILKTMAAVVLVIFLLGTVCFVSYMIP